MTTNPTSSTTPTGIIVWWRGAAALAPAALRAAVTTRMGVDAAKSVPRRDDKKPSTALARALPRRSSRVGAFWRLLDGDAAEVVAVYAKETADAAAGAYDAHGATTVRVDRTTGDFVAAGPHVAEVEALRARYDAERGCLSTTDVGRVIVALIEHAGGVSVSPGIYLVPSQDIVDAIDRALDDAAAAGGLRPSLRWATVVGAEATALAPDVDDVFGADLARIMSEAEALAADVRAVQADADADPDAASKWAKRHALIASKRLERLDSLREAIRGFGVLLGARQKTLESRAAEVEATLLAAARSALERA